MMIVQSSAKSVLLITCLIVSMFASVHGQPKDSRSRGVDIGKPSPDFVLKNIRYSDKKEVSLKSLSGEFFILDFWTTNCTGCVRSFPAINALQKKFKGRLKFILIGRDELGRGGLDIVEKNYEKYKNKYNLELSSAYDTTLFTTFDVPFVSDVIWVDDKGIVRAITASSEVDSTHIEEFLSGKPVTIKDAMVEVRAPENTFYQTQKPLLINGNGGDDTSYVYRTILAKWNPKAGFALPGFLGYDRSFEAVGINLKTLYFYAFFGRPYFLFSANGDSLYGKISNDVILDIKDPEIFSDDWSTGKNTFSCAVENRRYSSRDDVMTGLQNLLYSYFGYKANVETREMPCWKLVRTQNIKQQYKTRLKGPMKPIIPEAFKSISPIGFVMENRPIDFIIRAIWCYQQEQVPFIDNTGIDYPVDFSFDAVMTDFEDVKSALRKQGLDLIKGTQQMRVLVLSDH